MDDSPRDIWIKADEALARFRGGLASQKALKDEIADALRDGKLRSRARLIREVHVVSLTKAFELKEDLGTDFTEIDPLFWLKSVRWTADTHNWRWHSGNFFVTTKARKRPRTRIVVFELELNVQDLSKLFIVSDKSKGGRPPERAAWEQFWYSLIQLAIEDKLNTDNFRDRAELRHFLLLKIDQALSDETLKPIVRKAWARFIDPSI